MTWKFLAYVTGWMGLVLTEAENELETQSWVAVREKDAIWLSFPCIEFEVSEKR